MKKVSNTYFQALLDATIDGRFPNYSDFWRYHHRDGRLEQLDILNLDLEFYRQISATYQCKNVEAAMVERRAQAMSDDQRSQRVQ